MNLRWLVLFAAVAEANSFTQAAVKLNVAQPWVSAQIRQLEELIGVKLFERTKSGIEITDAGRELLPYAQKVAEGAENFKNRARTLGEDRSHLIRIGSQISSIELPKVRQLNLLFQKRYPNYAIETTRRHLSDLYDMLEYNIVDCAICFMPPESELDRFEYLSLTSINPYLLGQRGASLSLDQLADQTITLPPIELASHYKKVLYTQMKAQDIDIRIAPEAGISAIKHFVRKGFGTALMLTGSPSDFNEDKELIAAECDLPETQLILARLKTKELGRAARLYWNLAEQSL